MNITQIQQIILLSLVFSLTSLGKIVNPKIVHSADVGGENTEKLIRYTSLQSEQSLIVSNLNHFTKIIVSFGSICCGIDHDTQQKLLSFVQKKYPQVKFTEKPWGREGEITYTFFVASLSPQARATFLSRLKQIVKDGKYINIEIVDKQGHNSGV